MKECIEARSGFEEEKKWKKRGTRKGGEATRESGLVVGGWEEEEEEEEERRRKFCVKGKDSAVAIGDETRTRTKDETKLAVGPLVSRRCSGAKKPFKIRFQGSEAAFFDR